MPAKTDKPRTEGEVLEVITEGDLFAICAVLTTNSDIVIRLEAGGVSVDDIRAVCRLAREGLAERRRRK